MIGDAMALVLRTSTHQQWRSVNSLAGECFRIKRIFDSYANERLPTRDQLRPWQRAVNRCQLAGLLNDEFRLTPEGLIALSQTMLGQAIRLPEIAETLDDPRLSTLLPVTRDLLHSATKGNGRARFILAFLHWASFSTRTPNTRALATKQLGREGVGDSDTRTLPLFDSSLVQPVGANTGAPPQPPYANCVNCPYTPSECPHRTTECNREHLARKHHAK